MKFEPEIERPVTIRKSYHTTRRGFANRCHVNMADSEEFNLPEFSGLLEMYQKRCVSRLATFLAESKRMSGKVQQVFDKLKELDVEVISMEIDKTFSERITNKRKRCRGLRVELKAKKKGVELYGTLLVTPSSLKMYLGSEKIAGGTPIYTMTYYRSLVVHDNYLAAMVKGDSFLGKRRFF